MLYNINTFQLYINYLKKISLESCYFGIQLYRHGARSPVIILPGLDKFWPKGPGQLTDVSICYDTLILRLTCSSRLS